MSGSACCLGADPAFLDSEVVVVLVSDSVVVERWSSGFVVGGVRVGGGDGYFGECVTAPVEVLGDRVWIVGYFCVEVEPPFDHAALFFSASASVVSSE